MDLIQLREREEYWKRVLSEEPYSNVRCRYSIPIGYEIDKIE